LEGIQSPLTDSSQTLYEAGFGLLQSYR
jgi:hypothetical protein